MKNLVMSSFMFLLLMSCGHSDNKSSMNSAILGSWNKFSNDSGNQLNGSVKTYFADSTFYWDFGDYSEEGIYEIEDSVLKITNMSGGGLKEYKIIELNDSIFKYLSNVNEDTLSYFKMNELRHSQNPTDN